MNNLACLRTTALLGCDLKALLVDRPHNPGCEFNRKAGCDMWRWLICGAQLKFCLEPRLDARLRHINYFYNDRRNAINSGLLAHRLFALLSPAISHFAKA
jgi:hypothetical protein